MGQDYRYKAFISYRHTPRDKAIAEKLQKKLESYHPPKGLKTQEKWKIFRDETELSSHSNLSGGIKEALKNSEFLIVICSESTKKSKWCLEEISFFKEIHNGSTEKIIPLVTGGDPETVFPDEMLTTAVMNELTGEYEMRSVEPLAANVAADTMQGSMKLLKTEFLRVAAPLLGCGYDNLYLRDRRRRRKRTTALVASITAAVLAFSVYTLMMLMKISSQNVDLEAKNVELDLTNSNLTAAYGDLDTANNKLKKINNDLDDTNHQLRDKNTQLDNANTELKNINDALDSANSQLTQKKEELEQSNKALDDANAELTDTNSALESANAQLKQKQAELEQSNLALEEANSQLTQKKEELEQSNLALAEANAELEQKKAALEQTNAELKKTNDELEKKKRELEESYAALKKANEELTVANAEIKTNSADSLFTYHYDRIGSLRELLSSSLYQDHSDELLPSSTLLLNKILYSYNTNPYPRLRTMLEAQGYIVDFTFSPGKQHIVAYDKSDNIYVFDVATGKEIYRNRAASLKNVRMTDENHLTYADQERVVHVDLTTKEADWSIHIENLSRKIAHSIRYAVFSDDNKRMAIWDNSGYYGFLDAATGELLYEYKTSDFMESYYIGNQSDFSDGVHFSAVCYDDPDKSPLTWLVSVNIDTKKYYRAVLLDCKYITATRCLGNDEIAALVWAPLSDGSGDVNTQLRIYTYASNHKTKLTVSLADSYLYDSNIVTSFTTGGDGDPQSYVAAVCYEQLNNRYTVYFVNTATGEVVSEHFSSAVADIQYYQEDCVIIGLSDGTQSFYYLNSNRNRTFNKAYHSQTVSADGSAKMVWADKGLAAAMGENTTNIMVYREEEPDPETTVLPYGGNSQNFAQILVSEDYIVGLDPDELYVYDAHEKQFLYYLDPEFPVSEAAIYDAQLVLVDQVNNILVLIPLGADDSGYEAYPLEGTTTTYSISVSDDGRTLTVINDEGCYILTDNEEFDFILFEEDLDKNTKNSDAKNQTKVSPDGRKIIVQSFTITAQGAYHYTLRLVGPDRDELILAEQDSVPFFNPAANLNAQSRVAFSDDSSVAAVALDEYIRIFDTATGGVIGDIPTSGITVRGVAFESDGERILAFLEDGRLYEYEISSAQTLRSMLVSSSLLKNEEMTAVPQSVTMQVNDTRGELVIYNLDYGCTVDLEHFAVTAEIVDDKTMILGFDEASQQFLLFNIYEDWIHLIPVYSDVRLVEKAQGLLAQTLL